MNLEVIKIKRVNNVFIKIICDDGIARELWEKFSLEIPNKKFHPKVKSGQWNGVINLFSLKTGQIYAGLLDEIIKFSEENNYSVEYLSDFSKVNFSVHEAEEFIKTVNLPSHIEVRPYQLKCFIDCVRNKTGLNILPTGCHARGDKVLTKNGWINIEDIKVDDLIIGSDGKEKKVLRLFTGKDDIYEIIPRGKEESIKVTKDHILPIRFSDATKFGGYCKGNKNYTEYISVEDYVKKSKFYKHCSKITYNENVFEIDNRLKSRLSPYFIGLYLGDGSSHHCQKVIIEILYGKNLKN